jgi:hypothetical protein
MTAAGIDYQVCRQNTFSLPHIVPVMDVNAGHPLSLAVDRQSSYLILLNDLYLGQGGQALVKRRPRIIPWSVMLSI